jgi:hypothetical protein
MVSCVPVIKVDVGSPVIYSCRRAAAEPIAPKPVANLTFKPGIQVAHQASKLVHLVLSQVNMLFISFEKFRDKLKKHYERVDRSLLRWQLYLMFGKSRSFGRRNVDFRG